MNKKELKFIFEQGEGQFIEFKETLDKSISKEITAFANSKGGRIFLGITDKGQIKGIKITNSLKSKIIDIAKNCDPAIKINLTKFEKILIIEVEESTNKPNSCSNGFHLRIGANSQKLSRSEIFEFAISEGKISFDEQINEEFAYPDDFDVHKFKTYLKEVKLSDELDTESILFNLGVAKRINEKLKLNNAGILFFAKTPSKFFMTSKVVCAEYARNEKVEILDRKIYDEGILNNLQKAINFIKKKIKIRFIIKSARRKEIPQFPEEAYREAIVNSILHRDYYDKSSDIMIENYLNKLIIYNPGGLVKWLKPEEFGKISKTRNQIIASMLARTIYAEKMGTGIKRINNSMKAQGLKPAKFEHYEHSFYVELKDLDYERISKSETNLTQIRHKPDTNPTQIRHKTELDTKLFSKK